MRPQDLEKEEILLALQDVLTSVASGHPENLRCPICEKGNLDAEMGEDNWVRVSCPQCGLSFEGLVGNPEETYSHQSRGKVRDAFG
ncbi:MAG: hypothetical protein EXR77_08710 [Myxococcales bacterium]|nr:hypothetical protein [Myxococcales bacterium]